MTELVVNIILILAVLVLVTTWLIGATRGRRHDRRQHAEERQLILQAFLGAAAKPTEAAAPSREDSQAASTTAAQPLDPTAVARLLDLLEDRRPPRRGLAAGLVNGPRGVWAAGARAGQHVGRRTLGQRTDAIEQSEPQLYRAAAREILDIHTHVPHDARLEYRRYADALGDPELAQLYLRSAAHANCDEPDNARLAVEQITDTGDAPRPGRPPATPIVSAS